MMKDICPKTHFLKSLPVSVAGFHDDIIVIVLHMVVHYLLEANAKERESGMKVRGKVRVRGGVRDEGEGGR